ncbi:hypothetical protein QM999_09575 [Pectobacterium cacticida]|uniref:hypothetical protein n=1 Tax=Pectobacterium cacticida TaxID=69221 RepID=UPI002FF03EF6
MRTLCRPHPQNPHGFRKRVAEAVRVEVVNPKGETTNGSGCRRCYDVAQADREVTGHSMAVACLRAKVRVGVLRLRWC